MNQRKITVTTGTRAEYGILRPILYEIQKNPSLKLFLIVTGMHLSEKHGNTINEIKHDNFPIFKTINLISKKDSDYENVKQLGNAIVSFSEIFHKIKPDINLVLGDRDEMLASTIAAYHMNIVNANIISNRCRQVYNNFACRERCERHRKSFLFIIRRKVYVVCYTIYYL